jgi:hypothetical protein
MLVKSANPMTAVEIPKIRFVFMIVSFVSECVLTGKISTAMELLGINLGLT